MTIDSIRILHSVGTYLNMSENWIYPQIAKAPDTTGRVLCKNVANPERFPLKGGSLITEQPQNGTNSIRRLFDGAARRVGLDAASMMLRVRTWRPQIIHAHFGPRGWQSIALKNKLGIPLVTSFYGYDAWQLPKKYTFWKARYLELFEKGELFLVEGSAMRERLLDLGCPEGKIRLQHIGVDLRSLPFAARDFSSGLRIVMVGRFVEKKGLVDGLKACALARSGGADLDVTVIGDGTDAAGQQIKDELRSTAERPELKGRVTFAGFVPLEKMSPILQQHNVFLCPSKHAANGDAEGGSPVVLTEAMSLGMLCIGTRHCDIPELIIDGQTGYLCDEHDISGIATVLMGLNTDPKKLLDLTLAGREHVSVNYSLFEQLKMAHTLYQDLLTKWDDSGVAQERLTVA